MFVDKYFAKYIIQNYAIFNLLENAESSCHPHLPHSDQ